MDARKRITQVIGLALIAQLLAFSVFESIWFIVIGPPVVVALPVALLTMRSPSAQTINLRQAYVGVALVSCAVIASFFLWSSDELSFDRQFLRMWFVDLAILWLASTLGVHAATMRQPS